MEVYTDPLFICQYCGRADFTRIWGLHRHEKHCEYNPDRVPGASTFKNRTHSEYTKELIRQKKTGVKLPEEICEKRRGIKLSPEHKAKISAGVKKALSDPNVRQKMSDTKKGEKNSFYNKHHTDESKKKIKDNHAECDGENNAFYGKHHSDETKKLIGDKNRGKPSPFKGKRVSTKSKLKRYNTMRRNKSFNSSDIEEKLKAYFDHNNINYIAQYRSDVYPYMCDFYFPDKDLYVEIQGTWTHGGMPFDKEDKACIDKLRYWEYKAEGSDFYKAAIHVWTVSDVNKREWAKAHNLNWIEIFSIDFDKCLKQILDYEYRE